MPLRHIGVHSVVEKYHLCLEAGFQGCTGSRWASPQVPRSAVQQPSSPVAISECLVCAVESTHLLLGANPPSYSSITRWVLPRLWASGHTEGDMGLTAELSPSMWTPYIMKFEAQLLVKAKCVLRGAQSRSLDRNFKV
jgi:hypothetical protein